MPRPPADAGPYGTPPGPTAPYGTSAPYGSTPPGGWPPGVPAQPPRKRRTGLIIGIVVGVVVIIAALVVGGVLLFGSKSLDPASAQSAIASGVQTQFGVTPTDVHCPSGITAKAGSTFTCTAKLDGQPISFSVRQTDDNGHVSWHSTSNIAPVKQLEDAVAKQVGDQAGVTATASCDAGGRTVVVGATTSPIRCTVTNASDSSDSVDVDASIDAQGHVSVQQAG
jgi:hypothetical protein